MRVAALADVHGNAPALDGVLEEVEREAARPRRLLRRPHLGLAAAGDARARACAGDRRPASSGERGPLGRHRARGPGAVDGRAAHGRGRRLPRELRADGDGRGRRARRDVLLARLARAPTRSASRERTPDARVREFMDGDGAASSSPLTCTCSTTAWSTAFACSVRGASGSHTRASPVRYWAMLGPDVELRRTAVRRRGRGCAHARDGRSARRADRRADARAACTRGCHRARGGPRVLRSERPGRVRLSYGVFASLSTPESFERQLGDRVTKRLKSLAGLPAPGLSRREPNS